MPMTEAEWKAYTESTRPKRVRLWTLWNHSFVKLTISTDKDAKPIQLYRSWRHDEGWSSQGKTLWVEDGYVYSECGTDGTDCDGRMSTYRKYRCHIDELKMDAPRNTYDMTVDPQGWLRRFLEIDGVVLPNWQQIDAENRDYQAEAAGY